MRKIFVLILFTIVLSGCQTAKYTLDQTFGDGREPYVPGDIVKSEYSNNLLAKTDSWIKKHLW